MKRVTYISNFTDRMSFEDVEQIGEISVRNNTRDDLSGVLFCYRNVFYQVLEGPEEKADATLERIKRDERHANVFILNVEQDIKERLYPDWKMKTVVLDDNQDYLVRPIKMMLDSIARNHRWLEKYSPQTILKAIQNGEDPTRLPPRQQDALILFADIVGFTTFSEFMPPAEITSLLDQYYELMNRALLRHGEIMKMTGDGLAAHFSIEKIPAVIEACIQMQRDLERLRTRQGNRSALGHLYTGIGLASGKVIATNVGSDLRRDYTLFGDSVNVASRVEGITRKVKRGLLFTDTVASRIEGRPALSRIARYNPKGKSEYIDLYTIDLPELKLPPRDQIIAGIRSLQAAHPNGTKQLVAGVVS